MPISLAQEQFSEVVLARIELRVNVVLMKVLDNISHC